MVDIERFQHQKVIDLKETLAAYCVLQFKLARKVGDPNLELHDQMKSDDCDLIYFSRVFKPGSISKIA